MLFTPQERSVLLTLVLGLTLGLSIRYVLIRFPHLTDIVNGIEDSRYMFTVDVNRATYEDLLRVPYIGPATARAILEYRNRMIRIQDIAELQALPNIRSRQYGIFRDYLRIVP